jgi:hypothetical protein
MRERTRYLTEAGTLVNAAEARIDRRKLDAYALNPDHSSGGHKALVFERVLGYNRSNADELVAVIRRGIQETEARPGFVNQHGSRFFVDLIIRGPTRQQAIVRTAWIYRPGQSIPSLTSAYVRRKTSDAKATTA